ncbi:MAG: aminoglycoside phosphotransferase family protein [Victivallales bacterium]|nr:aminoglycoside phosphotransferase family protein [Victivallales bacterium]
MSEVKEIIAGAGENFAIHGVLDAAQPYGSGHINDTYAATYDQAGTKVRYIFQRINTNVFRKPESLMSNIARVTSHLWSKANHSLEMSRSALRLVYTREGKHFLKTATGEYWRVYLFIEGARTYDVMTSASQAFFAARAFGHFQCLLADLPGDPLECTIPDFHNTPKRLEALKAAIKQDPVGRAKDVPREIKFVLEREATVHLLEDAKNTGKLPERVTHNDTKLNNVMIDDVTAEGICVIDLDTVMPGLVAYDFGDLVRTSVSPAAEDELNLDKVCLRMEMIEALAQGYFLSAGSMLTKDESESLTRAGEVITIEIGIRFLTDYLSGDVYFKTKREGHNLDRCRVQFKIVELLEKKSSEIKKMFSIAAKKNIVT